MNIKSYYFNLILKIEDYYFEKFADESHDLSHLDKLNDVVLNLTVLILFLLKYPYYVMESVVKEYE